VENARDAVKVMHKGEAMAAVEESEQAGENVPVEGNEPVVESERVVESEPVDLAPVVPARVAVSGPAVANEKVAAHARVRTLLRSNPLPRPQPQHPKPRNRRSGSRY